MNNRVARFLRKTLETDLREPESKRIYRKFKKQYTSLPLIERKEFLSRLKLLHTQYTN